jgi:phytoene dehydrogenase-like protein
VAYDAVVVGAGPNGLAAAIELARAGLSVLVREANSTTGGAARTEELTVPGVLHDVGSAVYPMGMGSPFLSSLPLAEHGLEWVHPTVPVAHPLGGGRAVLLHRSLDETVEQLGRDGPAYRRLVEPFVRSWGSFAEHLMDTPFRPPRQPVLMGRFALRAIRSAAGLARRFRSERARALLAGNAAHSGVPLDATPSGAIALALMIAAHAVGWPVPRGGAGSLTAALTSLLESLGGTIETHAPVQSLDELPAARAVLLAITPAQIARVGGPRLPAAYRRRLERWRYGPGAYKMDWTLDGSIPWASEACGRAGTVHIGGTLAEIALAERAPWQGRVAAKPFVLLAQPSRFDDTRAPAGMHTVWAYCHVPNGWAGDASLAVEAQIERFAPGFRERIIARRVHTPRQLEAWDANLVGGDVNGGAGSLSQMFGRTRWTSTPWSTPVADLYVCSAATPPGGGVHGMCGFHAARAALRHSFERR